MGEVLRQLRDAGAGALAVRETTIGELVALGNLFPVAMQGAVSLASTDPDLLSALAVAIHAKLPGLPLGVAKSAMPALVTPGMAMDQLVKLPVLLRPDDLRVARGAGLRVVGRLMNFPAASPGAISAAAVEARAAGARLIVFREDQVLGFPDLIESAAEALRRFDLLYGHIEIISQKGSEPLAAQTATRLVRVHSITDADMQMISPDAAIQRYRRAVAERNIRACYVRLILRPQPDPMAANQRYLSRVVNAIRGRGLRIGPPEPFIGPEGWPPRWARALVLLALPAALVVLLRRLAPMGTLLSWSVFVLLCALGAVIAVMRAQLAVALAGLAAACVFPTLALVWTMQWTRIPAFVLTGRKVLARALVGLVATCAITLVGAVLIVGLYSPVRYLEGIGGFWGVKLAYLTPLLLVFLAAVIDLTGGVEPFERWRTRVRTRGGQFFSQPVSILLALVVLVALGLLVFVVSRSGNRPAVTPTVGELKLRHLLESLLFVRPRTKEFLLGHPALMLVVALSLRGRRTWLPLFVILAGIGQISLLNTFCHFHSPLPIGLIRTANGMWLGALVGLTVLLGWLALSGRLARHRAAGACRRRAGGG